MNPFAWLQQQFNAVWSSAVAYISQGAAEASASVNAATANAGDAAATAIGNVGNALDGVSQWFSAQLQAVYGTIDDAKQTVHGWLQPLAERARQYQLARLAANPAAVMLENLLTISNNTSQAATPSAGDSTPWVALSEVQADMLTLESTPDHPASVALAEVLADMTTLAAGGIPDVPGWVTDPNQVPGVQVAANPAGSDPNARDLLTPSDVTYVQSTTSGGS